MTFLWDISLDNPDTTFLYWDIFNADVIEYPGWIDTTTVGFTGVVSSNEDGTDNYLTSSIDMPIGRFYLQKDKFDAIPFDGVLGLSATKDATF